MRISELFYSIQGEGLLAGTPSAFVRVAGCNLRCAWCDASYAWSAEDGTERSVQEILDALAPYPSRFVVLTGGEPMRAPDTIELASRLRALGKHLTIETNATVQPRGIACDLASLSPKLSHAGAPPHDLETIRAWLEGYAFQLKFVVRDAPDVEEIRQLLSALARPIPPERVLLMPEGVDPETLRARAAWIAEACKRHGFRFGPRLHVDLYGNRRGT